MRDVCAAHARGHDCAVITGPTGAIGVALCKLLSDSGVRVFAVVRPNSPRIQNLAWLKSVEIVECDVSKLKDLPRLLGSIAVDAFYHLAWTHTVGAKRNDSRLQLMNIGYALDACHVAKELGCTVFLGAGSQAEYGLVDHALRRDTPCFPENCYGMAKLCAGQMTRLECEKLGIAHLWPRILSVYGPYDGESSMIAHVIRKLLAGEKPSLTAGTQVWDYLYADDAARALYAMAVYGSHGAVYPLGGGEARPLRDYIVMLRDEIDPTLPLGFGEIPYGPKQVMHLEADIGDLEHDVGFMPLTSFSEGIRNTIEYYRGCGTIVHD